MLTLKNMSFKTGKELTVTGRATKGTGFSINIGHDEESLALHFNPRFSEHGDCQTIVCNSKQRGTWQCEQRESSFPFRTDQEFKVIINYTAQAFNIKLPTGTVMSFPNRFGDKKFKHIHVAGDVRIYSFSIM